MLKRWNTYQYGEYYQLEFDVTNMVGNVITDGYYSREDKIIICYHDESGSDCFYGNINKYKELVDKHQVGNMSYYSIHINNNGT